MSKYMATIIDFFNHDASIDKMSTPTEKIHELLKKFNTHEEAEFRKAQLAIDETEF